MEEEAGEAGAVRVSFIEKNLCRSGATRFRLVLFRLLVLHWSATQCVPVALTRARPTRTRVHDLSTHHVLA